MEDPRSVNSPRRVLSLSRQRRGTVSFPEPDHKSSGFGVPGEHGPKPSEVYGFVGSISTVVATVIFLIWAYVPEPWLHSIGIYYYPSRYWALAVPTYAMVTIVLAIGFYIGLNFMVTPPPTSLNTIFDEYSREPLSLRRKATTSQLSLYLILASTRSMISCLMVTNNNPTLDDPRAAPLPYIPYDIIGVLLKN